MKGFASDNYSGVHPDILKSIADANDEHVIAYGDDPYTAQAVTEFKKLFGEAVEVYFTFIGTAANVLGIKAITQPYHAVICAETAHINVDECGAPERFTSCKLLSVKTDDGKLRVADLKRFEDAWGFEHHVQPKVISISQPTELGTLYQPEEIKALADYAHEHDMFLHMDGARIANAAAALNKTVKSFTLDCGVDVLSFGGTKNGMMYGEAIVFADQKLCKDFKYIRKQGMQLASKMRFISAQFLAYLKDGHYLKTAEHANKAAKLLEKELLQIKAISITQKVECNAIFAVIPEQITVPLQEKYPFYVWDAMKNEVRWMCSWDTKESEIFDFIDTIKTLLK